MTLPINQRIQRLLRVSDQSPVINSAPPYQAGRALFAAHRRRGRPSKAAAAALGQKLLKNSHGGKPPSSWAPPPPKGGGPVWAALAVLLVLLGKVLHLVWGLPGGGELLDIWFSTLNLAAGSAIAPICRRFFKRFPGWSNLGVPVACFFFDSDDLDSSSKLDGDRDSTADTADSGWSPDPAYADFRSATQYCDALHHAPPHQRLVLVRSWAENCLEDRELRDEMERYTLGSGINLLQKVRGIAAFCRDRGVPRVFLTQDQVAALQVSILPEIRSLGGPETRAADSSEHNAPQSPTRSETPDSSVGSCDVDPE
jgi:hypothetical protein